MSGNQLLGKRFLLSVGHGTYWLYTDQLQQRTPVRQSRPASDQVGSELSLLRKSQECYMDQNAAPVYARPDLQPYLSDCVTLSRHEERVT